MTPTQRAAMEQALEKLKAIASGEDYGKLTTVIDEVSAALAEQPAEPVAWQGVYDPTDLYWRKPPQTDVRPLYTAPQPGKRVPLTEEQIDALWLDSISGPLTATKFARTIERAHGITGETE